MNNERLIQISAAGSQTFFSEIKFCERERERESERERERQTCIDGQKEAKFCIEFKFVFIGKTYCQLAFT